MTEEAGQPANEQPPEDKWTLPPEPAAPTPPQGRFAGFVVPRDETVRAALAIAFTVIFALTVAWACFAWGIGIDVREILQVILPAETGLLGSAVGFYFGSASNRRQ